MKTLNKILGFGLAALAFASCADLDTEYHGKYVTPDQKAEAVKMDPEKAQASITGCFAGMVSYGSVAAEHWDFGYAASMLGFDLQGLDVLGKYSGYDHFTSWQGYVTPSSDGVPTSALWSYCYKTISSCNAVCESLSADATDPQIKFYRAQALGLRAYLYFVLAQSYAFNYADHKTDPCVPVITEKNYVQAASEGCARSTVEEVYGQVYSDINEAIALISESGIHPSKVIASKPHRMLSLAAAYGLRARINLVAHNYNDAAADAQKAIENFTGRPYSMEEVSRPAFNSLDDPAWMWGLAVAETDRVVTTGIVNWPSFMVSLCDGYVNAGTWRYCGYKLYSYLPSSDVRKGWFLDDDYKSDHLTEAEQAYLDKYVGTPNYFSRDDKTILFPQTNVKFAPYKNELGTGVNANDIPLMRIEEMYLTLAEAQGMSGSLATGKQTLAEFVKTYRNPNYTCTASSPEEFQEECWMQRRAELWGEGLSFFDILRLNKGIDRQNNRQCYVFRYNIPAGDPVLIYSIPRKEINANPKISLQEAGNQGSRPTPILEPALDGN